MTIIARKAACGSAVLFLAFFATSIAEAQVTGQPEELSAIYACKTETNPEKRLACYDTAVGRFETAQKSGEVVTVSKKAIEKVERDAFGFNIPSLPGLGKLFGKSNNSDKKAAISQTETNTASAKKDKKVKKTFDAEDMTSVDLKIRKITEFGYKKKRFFMTNGQVWEQTDTTKLRVPKARKGNLNTAEISKAALGSFLLQVNGKGVAIRVRRVR